MGKMTFYVKRNHKEQQQKEREQNEKKIRKK